MMVKKIVKLVLINILVLFALIIITNLIAISIYQIRQAYKKTNSDTRGQLPNYKGIEWANQHFKEFEEIPTEYRSYIGWRRLKYSGNTINIDESGIRITPQHESVDQNSTSVVFMGGSTMWGTGANDKTTIPALFSETGKGKYKTFNFGESSYNAFQSYLFLRLKINEGFKPDIVISYDGVNNTDGFFKNRNIASHNREVQIQNRMRGQDRDASEYLSFQKFLFGPIKEFLSIIRKKTTTSKIEYDLSHKRTEQVAKELLNSWLASKSLAEENGALFFCVLQPNAGVGNPNIEHLTIDPFEIKPYNQFYSMILKLLNTSEYIKLSNNFIDLKDILNGDEKYYIDFCHLSPNGNQVVVDNLILEINKRINKQNNQEVLWTF